jgi:alkylhydroperoxidase family enzyme
MARIRPVMGTPATEQGSGTTLDQVSEQAASIFGHRPEMKEAFDALQALMHHGGTLSPRLKELVRLRIAFHNQCRTCMALQKSMDSIDEGVVCSLERPEEAANLTDAERAALRYADLMANDHLSIDDDTFDELREFFDEGEIVELGMVCGFNVGFGRLAASWRMDDFLPSSFRSPGADGTITPWGHDAVVGWSETLWEEAGSESAST